MPRGRLSPDPQEQQPLPAPKSAIASMTGFARRDGHVSGQANGPDGAGGVPGARVSWAWEAKAVNAKGLDLRLRLPPGYDALEARARAAAPKHLGRGSLSLTLNVAGETRTQKLRVNAALLAEIVAAAAAATKALGSAAAIEPPRLDGLLGLRGVLEPVEPDLEEAATARAALDRALEVGLDEVLAGLAAMRREEGARLAAVIVGHLDEIARLAGEARRSAAAQPQAIRARFDAQVAEILGAVPSLPPERVAQEVALLVAKADVREELDRLDAHVAQARDLLAEGGAVGRRFDFLCQEFNREANTLCSKSAELDLTRIGLALKAAVEQLREQVQNVE